MLFKADPKKIVSLYKITSIILLIIGLKISWDVSSFFNPMGWLGAVISTFGILAYILIDSEREKIIRQLNEQKGDNE